MFGKQTNIIKDGKKLGFDYVPKTIVGREKQISLLSMIFGSVINEGRSETAYMTGSIGTGKTSTAMRFVMDMSEYAFRNNIGLDYIYVNCRQKSTDSAIIYQCLAHFDPKYPEKGFSPQDMLGAFKSHVERSKRRIVIILDEINVLLMRSGTELVYQLSRLSEGTSVNPISVSMILISQEYVLDRLDQASLSSFKRANTIRFEKYTRNQLRDIVEARVKEATVDGTVSDGAIDAIADLAAGDGDARMAIDILDKACRIAEMRTSAVVTADDVRQVSDLVYSVVNQPKLEELGKNEIFALLAVSRAIKKESAIPVSAAEKTYAIVCEEYNVTPRKHTQFMEYIDSLIKSGMLTSPGVDANRAKLVSIPDIPAKTLAKKIEKILEDTL